MAASSCSSIRWVSSRTRLTRRAGVLFAPSLTIDLNKDTRLTLLGQYYHEWNRIGFGLPAVGTVLPNINGRVSIFRDVGEPDTYPFDTDAWRTQIGYQLEHRFNEVFTLRQNTRAGFHWADFKGIFPYNLEADERTLDRYTDQVADTYTTLGIDTSLVAHFATGPWVNQTALAGVDFYYFGDIYKDEEGSIASLDIFQPHYGSKPYDRASDINEVIDTKATGLYFQDQIELFHRLTIVAGGRGDFVTNDVRDRLLRVNEDRFDTAFSPRAGIVYEAVPKTVSAYFSYSRSFLSQPYELGVDGQPLPPQRGEQYEVGVKANAFDGRFSSLLAVYTATRTNVATPDTANPLFVDATGEERHRGVDFENNASPVKGWDLIASYAYIDARVTKDNSGRVGDRVVGVPENTVSLWTKYTLQTGVFRGLGVGTGFRYLTRQAGDSHNTFALPSYGVLNMALYYRRGRLKAQVNVNNVTNERYFVGAFSDTSVEPGDPISVFSSVNWNF